MNAMVEGRIFVITDGPVITSDRGKEARYILHSIFEFVPLPGVMTKPPSEVDR